MAERNITEFDREAADNIKSIYLESKRAGRIKNQGDLAEICQVSQSMISQVFAYQVAMPVERIMYFCAHYNLPLNSIRSDLPSLWIVHADAHQAPADAVAVEKNGASLGVAIQALVCELASRSVAIHSINPGTLSKVVGRLESIHLNQGSLDNNSVALAVDLLEAAYNPLSSDQNARRPNTSVKHATDAVRQIQAAIKADVVTSKGLITLK